jgi:hypothetical protein
VGTVQIVLSWRLSTDTGGAVEAARRELRDLATGAEQDQGAARLFGSGTAMGPFATDQEILGFFERRLAGNRIHFSHDVCLRLGEIADRTPGWMNELSSKVYDMAVRDQVFDVQTPILNDCFHERYADEMKQAFDFCADLPHDLQEMCKALCALPRPATSAELVDHAFPTLPEPIRVGYVVGQGARLDEMCKKSAFMIKDGDKYKIASNVYRYALKIAMKLT